jgi:hypothetical protein
MQEGGPAGLSGRHIVRVKLDRTTLFCRASRRVPRRWLAFGAFGSIHRRDATPRLRRVVDKRMPVILAVNPWIHGLPPAYPTLADAPLIAFHFSYASLRLIVTPGCSNH